MNQPTKQCGRVNLGVVLALAIGVGFAVMIGWFVLKGASPQNANAFSQGDFDAVPDVNEILGSAESGKGLRLQFADKDDPSRVAATLEAESYSPVEIDGRIEPNLYELDQVQAQVFLDSGETVVIESESGRFSMPDRQSGPESGSLIGSPRVSLLPVGGAIDAPELVVQFDDALNFNFNYSHVETKGRIEVIGPGVEFVGHHLTARLNEQRRRIDVLEVERGEYIKYDPSAGRGGSLKSPTEPVAPGAREETIGSRSTNIQPGSIKGPPATEPWIVPAAFSTGQPTPAAIEPEHLALYRATFKDSVELKQGSKRVTADLLEAWVRLVNHKLPVRTSPAGSTAPAASAPEALLQSILAQVESDLQEDDLKPQPTSGLESPPTSPGQLQSENPATEEPSDEPKPLGVASASSDDLIELYWTGQLRVVPLVNSEPDQLAKDDAALRFTSTETGLVHFEDVGSSGHAAVAAFAATREELTLTGPGGSVVLEADDTGWIEASKTVVRLATGDVTVVGPGQINDGQRPAHGGRNTTKYVRWLDQADFQFNITDGRMTGDIQSAQFSGQARAVDGDRRFDGGMLVASFDDDGHGNRVISTIEGYDLTATDGRGATMSGERVELPFTVTEPGKSEPSAMYAEGNVVVDRDGSRIASQSLSAILTKDADGSLVVSDVVAQREASYTDGESIRATADRIEANGIHEIATLFGGQGEPARVDYEDSVIVGPQITFSQHPQRGSVVGAGSFEQKKENGRVVAAWRDRMTFDRTLGVLECVGEAAVDQVLVTGETRTTRGDQLIVEFINHADELIFDAATVFGSDAQLATVESRQAGDDGATDPVSLLHLQATEILATGGGDGLIVPIGGRLVVLDRREGAGEGLDGWDRGHAMFSWQSTMVVDRLLGTARLSGDARAIHRTLDDGRTAEIAADTIIASFEESDDAGFEVNSLDARGTAYFRMEDREVLAALLRFDSKSKILHAVAGPNEPIRFIDNTTGAVVSAQSLEWDMETDRIVVDQPSPIALPRGGG